MHFWARICHQNNTRLVVFNGNVPANSYINEIIQPVVIPFFQCNLRGGGSLQQDGAMPHTARLTMKFSGTEQN